MKKDPIEQLEDPLNMVTLELDQRQLIELVNGGPVLFGRLRIILAPYVVKAIGETVARVLRNI